MLTAMTKGSRFGVISILEQSIPRHVRYIRELGLGARCAGDRAIGLGINELGDGERTFDRVRDVAQRLRDDDGADVLILGCAGLADHRLGLEAAVGLPVVEPTQAATALAVGATLIG
jgi:Asp/Glu/hydantoin racemase